MPKQTRPLSLQAHSEVATPWLAWCALALAMLGAACAGFQFSLALGIFALAGISLLMALRRLEPGLAASPALGQGPGSRHLEAAYVLGLAVFSLLIRLYRLDLYPAGPAFVESVMSLDAKELVQAPYSLHVREAQAPFPSLIFYQGLAAAQCLGWKIQNFRIPSALWGALSVLAFYGLLRQCCSRFAAAVFAALFSVNNLNLTLSRLFFPGAPLFFSVCATAAFLLQGLRSGRTLPFALAGLCCGLGMHAYVPGRLLVPAYFTWLVWLQWKGSRGLGFRPELPGLAAFGGAALLVAAPILWWASKNPDVYSVPIRQNSAQGLLAGLAEGAGRLPYYVRMFYTLPDGILEPTDGLALFPLLRPDWLTQVFLPLGLVGALCAFWKPLPSLLLGGLVVGILPAAVAGNYPPPCTRRALMALPWVYALAALGWDQSMAALRSAQAPAPLRRTLQCLALALAAFAVAASLHQYFVEIMGRPSVRSSYNVAASLAGEEAARFPKARVMLSYDLLEPRTSELVLSKDTAWRLPESVQNFMVQDWPGGRDPEAIKQFEDFLVFKEAGPKLLLMAPYLRSALPLLGQLFPDGSPEVLIENRDFDSGMPPWDPYEPFVHLARFAVTAQDVQAFTGMVDLGQTPYGPGSRIQVFAPGFAARWAGRRMDLGAVYVVQMQGEGLRFQLPWGGWSLRVDGRAVAWDREISLDAGSHALELRGRVPAGGEGALPLSLVAEDDPDPKAGRLIPLDIRYGMRAILSPLPGSPSARPLVRFEPLPLHRFSSPEGLQAPFAAALESRIRVPADGIYQFRVRLPFHGRVWVGGKAVFDSLPGGKAFSLPVALQAAKPQPMRVECEVDGLVHHESTLILDALGPQDQDWAALPLELVIGRPWPRSRKHGRRCANGKTLRRASMAPDWLPFTMKLKRHWAALRLLLALFLNGLCALAMLDFADHGPAWMASVLAALFLALSWVPLLTPLPQDPRAARLRLLWDRGLILLMALFAAVVLDVAVEQLRFPYPLIDVVLLCLPACAWLIMDNYPGAWPAVLVFLFAKDGARGRRKD